jgi:hypothetical protein
VFVQDKGLVCDLGGVAKLVEMLEVMLEVLGRAR